MIRRLSQAAFGLAVVGFWSGLHSTPVNATDPLPIPWRSDYNAARKEAQEKGKLIALVIGTEECVYCRKQEATTFRDATVSALVKEHFLAVKIDASQDSTLANALKVQLYPTTVLASPDGKVLAYLQGYVSAEQFKDHAKRAVLQATTPDAVMKQLDEITRCLNTADHVRALVLLKHLLVDVKESPARTKAERMLATIEDHAAEKLAKAKQLDENGEVSASLTQLAELVRNYAGTAAAAEAAALLVIPAKGTWESRTQAARCRDLYASASQDWQAKRYADCLDKCQMIQHLAKESSDAAKAAQLASSIRNDPEILLTVCEQMNERTASLYLALAETWTRQGDMKKAKGYFERVVQLTPGSRTADLAQSRLASFQKGNVPTLPASLEK